ncbi:MAG: NAD(P)-dependent oxidoreductase, partial [Gammaproteobacteria bacterium]|nr:NAD(P)-dependent oxidoreductase [Gammaproteobacteria bacterium]
MAAENILVTGMSGLIGGITRERLEGRANLRALNRSDVAGIETYRADLADYDAIRPAFDGQDTVVHLAAKAGERYSWEELCDTNIIGTRNVYEAAKDAGCRRVIFASSGATVSGWENEEPYGALTDGRYQDVPDDWPM